jgi:hypothetical protein
LRQADAATAAATRKRDSARDERVIEGLRVRVAGKAAEI